MRTKWNAVGAAERRVALLLLAIALTGTCERAWAQERVPADGELAADAFVEAARRAAVPYRDRGAAIAAGYRRLGPGFPGMGEHWVHPGIIVRATISAREPSVLCYAEIAGQVRLVGVAYALPVSAGAPMPALPGGAAIWHVHDGSVDEETLLLTHRRARRDEGAARLVMTHVWTELENPAGTFAQNNWRLPFEQAGIRLLAAPDARAGQAASLLTVGVAYYDRLFTLLGEPSAAERARMVGVLEEARGRVHAWREQLGGAPVDARQLDELTQLWAQTWQALLHSVEPATAERLGAFDGAGAGHMH